MIKMLKCANFKCQTSAYYFRDNLFCQGAILFWLYWVFFMIWKNALFLHDMCQVYLGVHLMILETTWKCLKPPKIETSFLRAKNQWKWAYLQTATVGHLFKQTYKCRTNSESLRVALTDNQNQFLEKPPFLEKLTSEGAAYRVMFTKMVSPDQFFFLGHC